MGSIAEKLAAARNAAVQNSGLQTGMKSAASAAIPKQVQAAPKTPSKSSSVSVLRSEDLIPRRTKESQVLFQCIKPTLNFVIAAIGRPTKRVHFQNSYLLTEDSDVIEYTRQNAKHFGVSEVKQEIKKPVEPQKSVEPQKPAAVAPTTATEQKPV